MPENQPEQADQTTRWIPNPDWRPALDVGRFDFAAGGGPFTTAPEMRRDQQRLIEQLSVQARRQMEHRFICCSCGREINPVLREWRFHLPSGRWWHRHMDGVVEAQWYGVIPSAFGPPPSLNDLGQFRPEEMGDMEFSRGPILNEPNTVAERDEPGVRPPRFGPPQFVMEQMVYPREEPAPVPPPPSVQSVEVVTPAVVRERLGRLIEQAKLMMSIAVDNFDVKRLAQEAPVGYWRIGDFVIRESRPRSESPKAPRPERLTDPRTDDPRGIVAQAPDQTPF